MRTHSGPTSTPRPQTRHMELGRLRTEQGTEHGRCHAQQGRRAHRAERAPGAAGAELTGAAASGPSPPCARMDRVGSHHPASTYVGEPSRFAGRSKGLRHHGATCCGEHAPPTSIGPRRNTHPLAAYPIRKRQRCPRSEEVPPREQLLSGGHRRLHSRSSGKGIPLGTDTCCGVPGG